MQSSTKHKTKGATAGAAGSAQMHRGFTLVELLTVIVIIGILAGLIVAAVVPAMRRAKEAVIQTDINQIAMALEKYKQEYGDYPPDFAGVKLPSSPSPEDYEIRDAARRDVLRHLRKAFPRLRLGISALSPWDDLLLRVIQASTKNPEALDTDPGMDIEQLTPGSALVFWLGGPTDTTDNPSSKLVGFSANPANPFAIGGSRKNGLYEFDETRLVGLGAGGDIDPANGIIRFTPPHVVCPEGKNHTPYVYFRARSNGYLRDDGTGWLGGDKYATKNPLSVPSFKPGGCDCTCAPYAASSEQASSADPVLFRWKNPKTFQIISSGLDGEFGKDPPDPATNGTVRFLNEDQANIGPADDDNITNFTQGKLEDRPEE